MENHDRIVTICPDLSLVQPLTKDLRQAGYEVYNSYNLHTILTEIQSGRVKCAVIDARHIESEPELPELLRVCSRVPVVVLQETAGDAVKEAVLHGQQVVVINPAIGPDFVALEINRFIRTHVISAQLQLMGAKTRELLNAIRGYQNADSIPKY